MDAQLSDAPRATSNATTFAYAGSDRCDCDEAPPFPLLPRRSSTTPPLRAATRRGVDFSRPAASTHAPRSSSTAQTSACPFEAATHRGVCSRRSGASTKAVSFVPHAR